MLIKFTNTGALAGNDIWINPDCIIAVYEIPTDGGSLTTRIWGGSPAIEWIVEESMTEVIGRINNVRKSCSCN